MIFIGLQNLQYYYNFSFVVALPNLFQHQPIKLHNYLFM